MKLDFSLAKSWNITYNQNTSSESPVDPCGQTDMKQIVAFRLKIKLRVVKSTCISQITAGCVLVSLVGAVRLSVFSSSSHHGAFDSRQIWQLFGSRSIKFVIIVSCMCILIFVCTIPWFCGDCFQKARPKQRHCYLSSHVFSSLPVSEIKYCTIILSCQGRNILLPSDHADPVVVTFRLATHWTLREILLKSAISRISLLFLCSTAPRTNFRNAK